MANFFKTIVERFAGKNSASEKLNISNLLNFSTGGWHSKFLSNIYKDSVMTPHEEMLRAVKSYRTNSLIYAATNTMRDFIIGGDYKITLDDKNAEEFANSFFENSGLKENLQNAVLDLIVCGNAYFERVSGTFPTYAYIPTPERMYIDYDFEKDSIIRFVQEIPTEAPTPDMKTTTINYYGNVKKSVIGIPIKPSKILHLKVGKATIPFYGRGAVCVVANDVEVVKEIERAMAVISRYKAIPKKIISLDANPRAVDKFKNELNSLNDYENPITNVPVTIQDLTGTSGEVTFQPILDYLKRKLTVALAPEYIIHGEDTNRATSKEQRIGFLLRIKSIRDQISTAIENELKTVLLSKGFNTSGLKFSFGSFDIGEAEDNQNSALQGWNSGLLTLKEARELFGVKTPTDYDSFFKWELTQEQSQPVLTQNEPENDKGAEAEPNINK